MINKKYIAFASLVAIASVIVWWTGISSYITLEQLKLYREQLQSIVRDHYLLSVFEYIIFFAIATALFMPITVVLTIAGGFLFGVFTGAIYANIGATLGGLIAFLMVRYSFGVWLQKRYAKELVRFNQLVQEDGAGYLLSMQFLPITPFFLINLLAGMTKMSLWTFIWTTSVGIFPGTLLYTFAGQQLNTIEQVSDIFSYPILMALILLALLAVLPIAIKRYRRASAS